MTRTLLISAALTGIFCVAFSAVVGALMVALPYIGVLVLSFLSGAFGRIFAHYVFEKPR